ncbi:MAG: serine/threonine-protein kinase, partial [Planctomycetota bacterium]
MTSVDRNAFREEHADLDAVEEIMMCCLEKPEEAWPSALEEAARAHPDHADELRLRMAALVAFDGVTAAPSLAGPVEDHAWIEPIDDFEILEPLGRGGMGLVFRAHQASLDRPVALKLIRPERLVVPASHVRFQREVETVARLRHPNIVAIHGAGTSPERSLPYFSMELLEGATLDALLKSLSPRAPESLTGADLYAAIGGSGTPPEHFRGSWWEACVRTMQAIAEALEYAHGEGVLHRDVKPSNVMLEPTGRAVLFDFGLTSTDSDSARSMTQSGHPVGTLAYMSPEQLEGAEKLDGRTDVYSAGATLHELLALQAPFAGRSAASIQSAVLNGDLTPIRARNRRIPIDLATVVSIAMATRRGDRYGSAGAFASDLGRVLAREPIVARPPGRLRRAIRWTQRRPAAASAVALAVTLVVGVPLTLLALMSRHARELITIVKQEREAKEQALAANAELDDVLKFTLGLFDRADPLEHRGKIPDAREMLTLGAEQLGDLSSRPASRARVEFALGELFGKVTDIRSALPHLEAAI